MNKLSKSLVTLLTVIFFILKSNDISAQLNSAGSYIWNATDAPKVFNGRFQLSFVSNAQGFQSYGTVLAGGGYSNTQDGAAFQIYFPYNSTYGGIAPQVRLGLYDNAGWSSWNTFFTSANANLSTVDWATRNLTVFGNVLIGKTTQSNPSYKLDVDGIIRSQKVVVNSTGADFVFEPSYQLTELDSLNAFIRKYQHLPDVPSAEEMKNKGLDLGEDQILLLQKIEELTLYIIKINAELALKDKKIQQLESINLRVSAIENEIKKLKEPK
jgi:hypothetical protein